jgi:cytochrome b
MTRRIVVWDLPTRCFHWGLALCVTGLVITGNLGGDAMLWHFRFGCGVLTLLLFRVVWGFAGGHWSRFGSFIYSPRALVNYARGLGRPQDTIGHNPLGAMSVFALLLILAAQVSSGMMSDDEIAFAGPLSKWVSAATVSAATWYHKGIGKSVVFALVALHVGAILFHLFYKKENLIQPMIQGEKAVNGEARASVDTAKTRLAALLIALLCAGAVYGLVSLGG